MGFRWSDHHQITNSCFKGIIKWITPFISEMGERNRDRKGNTEMGKGYSPPKYLYCVYFSLQYYMVDEQSAVYKDQTSFTNLVWPRQISEALDQSQGVQKKKKRVTLVPEQRFWLKKKNSWLLGLSSREAPPRCQPLFPQTTTRWLPQTPNNTFSHATPIALK